MGSAQEHVRFERLDQPVGLIADQQDRPWDTMNPKRAICDTGFVPAIGQKVLSGHWRVLSREVVHLDRQHLVELTVAKCLQGCLYKFLEAFFVLHENSSRLPWQIAERAEQDNAFDVAI